MIYRMFLRNQHSLTQLQRRTSQCHACKVSAQLRSAVERLIEQNSAARREGPSPPHSLRILLYLHLKLPFGRGLAFHHIFPAFIGSISHKMAWVVISLCLVALANVVLGQDSTPSPSSAAPSIVTASGSLQATHVVTVGQVGVLLGCKHEFGDG